MKKIKLTDAAPYSGKRVQPFDGVKNYLSTGDLKDKGLSFEEVTFKSKPSRADILVSKGDILFAKMVNTNKVLQIDKKLDGTIVSTGFSVHKPDENVLHGNYLIQFLKNNSFLRQKNKLCTGAIQSAISNTGIEKIFVPVPTLSDQIQIANILSKAETLIEQRKQSIALLDEFLKSTFGEMFGSLLSSKNSSAKKMIGELLLNISNDSPIKFPNKNYQYIDISSIDNSSKKIKETKNILGANAPSRAKQLVQLDDILVSTVRPNLNAVAMVREKYSNPIASTGFCVLRVNPKLILAEYLFEICKQDFFIGILSKAAKGASYPAVSDKQVKEIKIPIPPMELQTQFANIVKKTEKLKEQYKNSLQELENLYGSLSQKAFKGDLEFSKPITA
ncbi:MAG: restriction endonuclease subunit S [Bacteroidota bacterium]